uniref:(California timema) hypothetical protein n=1 Tax=Timema californicum TaxID=61474 RepID=A0A7R9PC99_TIMCA|nr:unnamed protein product [Timema californicum]
MDIWYLPTQSVLPTPAVDAHVKWISSVFRVSSMRINTSLFEGTEFALYSAESACVVLVRIVFIHVGDKGFGFTSRDVVPRKGFGFTSRDVVPRKGLSFTSRDVVPRKGFGFTSRDVVPRKGFGFTSRDVVRRKGFGFTSRDVVPRKGFGFTSRDVVPRKGRCCKQFDFFNVVPQAISRPRHVPSTPIRDTDTQTASREQVIWLQRVMKRRHLSFYFLGDPNTSLSEYSKETFQEIPVSSDMKSVWVGGIDNRGHISLPSPHINSVRLESALAVGCGNTGCQAQLPHFDKGETVYLFRQTRARNEFFSFQPILLDFNLTISQWLKIIDGNAMEIKRGGTLE